MDEALLIEGCKRADRTAQRRLYDRYKTAMYTLAYRITGDFDDANTALQETFLAVFRQIGQFRKEATLGAWIRTILIRKAFELAQKGAALELLDYTETLDPDLHPSTDLTDVSYLERAIQSLPAGARAAFVLIEVEGFSHREAAALLGVSEGTTKSQLHYAKRKLRSILT
jgi:RNA polymerase sigma-70 factor (ECF subfamily)